MKLLLSAQVEYLQAMKRLDELVLDKDEYVWFLEHPSVYTIGSRGYEKELPDICQIVHTNRGGSIVYHGPGQRVIYFACNLKTLGENVSEVVQKMQEWIMRACKEVTNFNFCDNLMGPGVWIECMARKVAFIGLRVTSNGRLYHGVAINCQTDLSFFENVNTCGYESNPVGNLGVEMTALDKALLDSFERVFGVFIISS